MAAKHGTRRRYNDGCHCDACTAANNAYLQEYRQRRADGGPIRPSNMATLSSPVTPQPPNAGPVKFGVEAEIAGLAEARPGLAQVALALARILDNPKATDGRWIIRQPHIAHASHRLQPWSSACWQRTTRPVASASAKVRAVVRGVGAVAGSRREPTKSACCR
jgi:hypothetical protein